MYVLGEEATQQRQQLGKREEMKLKAALESSAEAASLRGGESGVYGNVRGR
jgi:hypothetical protein